MKRTKAVVPAAPAALECSPGDRALLIDAYRRGVIASWKRDAERGYRLTFAGRSDEYVEVANLSRYLEKLGGSAA